MPNGSLSLPAKLWLLAWDPEASRLASPYRLPYVVRAGALTQLAQHGQLVDDDGITKPIEDARTGDPVLDGLLELIAESRPRDWQTWVYHHAPVTCHAVRRQLVEAGYLRAERKRVLGWLRPRDYVLQVPHIVEGLRQEADRVLRGSESVAEVSAQDAALVALAADGRLGTVVSARDREEYEERLTALAEHSGAATPALQQAVSEVRIGLRLAAGSGMGTPSGRGLGAPYGDGSGATPFG